MFNSIKNAIFETKKLKDKIYGKNLNDMFLEVNSIIINWDELELTREILVNEVNGSNDIRRLVRSKFIYPRKERCEKLPLSCLEVAYNHLTSQ